MNDIDTEVFIENNKKEFLTIFNSVINRPGKDKLLDWLENKSDFFRAPASTKFHGNYAGGLCEHSINVYKRFEKNYKNEIEDLINKFGEKTKLSDESRALIALLHDICKANFYKESYRNVKNEKTGQWEQKVYYTIDEKLPYGHGEKSVFLLTQFITLSIDESICINWHMRGFDKRVIGGDTSISSAFEKFPLAVLFHISDMEATYFDEKVLK